MRIFNKFLVFLACFLTFPSLNLFAQVSINNDNSTPDASAMLDVKSASKGILIPRISFEQRNAIVSPAEGLMVFCTDCGTNGTISVYSSGAWRTYAPCISVPPTAGTHGAFSTQITWNWSASPGASGYKWNTLNNYSTASDIGLVTTMTETGLTCNTLFTRYIWAYSACGTSSPAILTQTTGLNPDPPTAGTHVPGVTQIVWKWNAVAGATGYKWSTTNDFSNAVDLGAGLLIAETGLTCNTAYTRYAWTFNSCGHSVPATLTQSTLACPVCGNYSITVNHVAGNVAPVTKTTTYGTVTNIPGELTKCWITSNLGSDHQATAVSDATEAAAGWYWQFNRKQGYKHDGTTRTPSTTWITSISETSDWITANDPCNIELGTTWHIPTYTEWYNVDNAGGWTTWTGPWGSGLKLHAAGYLSYNAGSLYDRGEGDDYWSNSQYSAASGRYLVLYSSIGALTYDYKSYGYSARCVRDN